MAALTGSGCSSCGKCPAPGISTRRAPGMVSSEEPRIPGRRQAILRARHHERRGPDPGQLVANVEPVAGEIVAERHQGRHFAKDARHHLPALRRRARRQTRGPGSGPGPRADRGAGARRAGPARGAARRCRSGRGRSGARAAGAPEPARPRRPSSARRGPPAPRPPRRGTRPATPRMPRCWAGPGRRAAHAPGGRARRPAPRRRARRAAAARAPRTRPRHAPGRAGGPTPASSHAAGCPAMGRVRRGGPVTEPRRAR